MKIRYFAWMKRTVGVPEEEVTPPAGIDTVGDLVVWLRGRSPGDVAVEYTLLGLRLPDVTIEEWTPVDSVSWLKAGVRLAS